MSLVKTQIAQATILKTIEFIAQKQRQMELLRQQLNHQITFNLQDAYMEIAKRQTSVNIKQLATFLEMNENNNQVLEKFVKWNSHQNSLNLSFVQFSALLVSKEDRLLAKMVLQREQMGAIPNFLLEIIRKIFRNQLQIHQYCMSTHLAKFQFTRWLYEIIDQNGDLDKSLLSNFFNHQEQQEDEDFDIQEIQTLFIRYLQTTGNITAQRLKYLWLGDKNTSSSDTSMKLQKQSTYITIPKSPKSLISYKSLKQFSNTQLRSEYFDCLNRPIASEDKQLRKKKSIEKHVKRFDLTETKFKKKHKNEENYFSIRLILSKLKQIIGLEQQTQNFRAQLCLCPDFYPVIFYDTIPRDKSNFVSAGNFRDYLEEFGSKFQINFIYLVFRKYCKEINKLDFNSFCTLFDVSQPEYYLLQKNRFVESLSDINVQTKKLFFLVLNTVIVNQSKINQIKEQLLSIKINLNASFEILFSQHQQGISEVQLKHFYQKYLDYDLSKKQIKLIWKRCGLNLKNEDKLRRQQLLKQILPEKLSRRNKCLKV